MFAWSAMGPIEGCVVLRYKQKQTFIGKVLLTGEENETFGFLA